MPKHLFATTLVVMLGALIVSYGGPTVPQPSTTAVGETELASLTSRGRRNTPLLTAAALRGKVVLVQVGPSPASMAPDYALIRAWNEKPTTALVSTDTIV